MEERIYIGYLMHDKNVSVKEISKKTGVSAATIYKLKQTKIARPKHCTRTSLKHPGGHPKKLTMWHERHLLRCISVLREEEGNFSAKRLIQRAGLSNKNVSNQTIWQCLNQNGYHYLKARKKGLISKTNQRKRRTFPKEVQTHYSAFYLNGVSLYYKRNADDQARAPKGHISERSQKDWNRGVPRKVRKRGVGEKYLS